MVKIQRMRRSFSSISTAIRLESEETEYLPATDLTSCFCEKIHRIPLSFHLHPDTCCLDHILELNN